MIAQFKTDDGVALIQLCRDLYPLRCRGAFAEIAAQIFGPLLAETESNQYNPTRDEVLLELHSIASATLDNLGRYEEARKFVSRWASDTEWEVSSFLRSPNRESGDDIPVEQRALLSAQSLLLQRCGVAEYRACRYDHARGYLKSALELSEWLISRMPKDSAPNLLLPPAGLVATNAYWLGCVELYQNRFFKAEEKFVMGLSVLTKAVQSRESASSQRITEEEAANRLASKQLAVYVTARLLLGLGLLNFHRGRLTDAKSNLLTANMLLYRDSSDQLRLLRSRLLLLSVDRINARDEATLKEIEKSVQELANEFQRLGHLRYFCRAQWTLGLVLVDLANLCVQPEQAAERAGYLSDALQIAERDRLASDSVTDQLQMDILKLRILRKLDQTTEAIKWGEFVIDRRTTKDQVFLHVESLMALAHVYYRNYELYADLNSLTSARSLVLKAQEEATVEGNYRAQALCTLHLARIADKMGDHLQALHLFGEWRHIEQLVEHDWIKYFAFKVKSEIESSNSVTFTIESESDLYKQLNRKLRQFLINNFANEKNDSAAATKIGVSRQTLAEWRKDLAASQDSPAGLSTGGIAAADASPLVNSE